MKKIFINKLNNNKNNHYINLYTKLIMIILLLIELSGNIFIKNINANYTKDLFNHFYCGTFFIKITKSANFISEKAFNTYNDMIKIPNIINYFSLLLIIITIILIFIFLNRIDKKKLLNNNSSNIIISLGILYLINNLIVETSYLDMQYLKEYATGFLKTATYYPQIYHIFIIPTIIICYGLILKNYENRNNPKYIETISKVTKIIIALIILISGLFIAYRFSTRLSELIFTLNNKNIIVKLPFYGYLIELSKSLAITEEGYSKLIIFRFIKDLPLFITSITSIVLFISILFKAIKGKINNRKNLKKLNFILGLLIFSSIYFNIMGYFEINILHKYFLSPYNNAIYTLAIRSYTDPIIYALIIYIFKKFIQIFPKEN